MKTLSNRELQARLQWMENQWNEPSRTDYYLMQAAQEAFYSQRKRPKDPKVGDWKLPFVFEKKTEDKPTVHQVTAWAKSKWFALARVTRDVIRKGLGKQPREKLREPDE